MKSTLNKNSQVMRGVEMGVNHSISTFEQQLAAARSQAFNNSTCVNRSSDLGNFKSARPSKLGHNTSTPQKLK
jgi:hypothetical protein